MLKPVDSSAPKDAADEPVRERDLRFGTVVGLPRQPEPEPSVSFESVGQLEPVEPQPSARERKGRAQRRLAEAKRRARLDMLQPEQVVAPRPVSVRIIRGIVQAVLMLAVLFGASLVMQRMIEARPERERRPRPETVYTIDTVPAVLAANRPTLNVFGEIVAGRTIDMRTPASGEIVRVDPGLRAGLRVSEGQELFAIDDFDARAALTEARAALAQARGQMAETEARIAGEEAQIAATEDQLTLAREDFARTERLVERGTVPAAQLETKRLALSQSEQAVATRRSNLAIQRAQLDTQASQMERLELRVEQAERDLSNTVMTAPFSGVVRSADAEVGRNVSPSDVLVSLYDAASLDARFLLTDAQYGRLATDRDPLIGRPATVTWTVGGEPYAFEAVVDRLGAEIATERGGVEVFAAVEAADGPVTLRPGAFVEITLPDRTFADTFRLPETALYDERDVYVDVDGTLERRSVVRLAYDGEDVIVRPADEVGLSEGERVMATRISRVDAGLRVRERGSARPLEPTGEGSRPELLVRVAEVNGMSVEQLRAMPRDERRALIREYRAANGIGDIDERSDDADEERP